MMGHKKDWLLCSFSSQEHIKWRGVGDSGSLVHSTLPQEIPSRFDQVCFLCTLSDDHCVRCSLKYTCPEILELELVLISGPFLDHFPGLVRKSKILDLRKHCILKSLLPWMGPIWVAIWCLSLRYARQVGDYPGANFALINMDVKILFWELFCERDYLIHGEKVKFLFEVTRHLELPPSRIHRFHLLIYSAGHAV